MLTSPLQAMVLVPRRVAWATPEEFQLVFSYLFTSEGDLQAQRHAINRVRPTFSTSPVLELTCDGL